MTVAELIVELQKLDQSLMVVTNGYEGGYEDIGKIGKPFKIILNRNTELYYGPHEQVDSCNKPRKGEIVKKAYLL